MAWPRGPGSARYSQVDALPRPHGPLRGGQDHGPGFSGGPRLLHGGQPPPRLWLPLLQEAAARGLARVGVVVDARALAFFQDLEEVLEALRPTVVYLRARPEVLLRRYNLTRRVHPLGAGNLMREIAEERRALAGLRGRAHLVVDTSELSHSRAQGGPGPLFGRGGGSSSAWSPSASSGAPPRRRTWSWTSAPCPTPTTTRPSGPGRAWTPRSGATSFPRPRSPTTGPSSPWPGSRPKGRGRRGGPSTPWPWAAPGEGTGAWPWRSAWRRSFPAGSPWRWCTGMWSGKGRGVWAHPAWRWLHPGMRVKRYAALAGLGVGMAAWGLGQALLARPAAPRRLGGRRPGWGASGPRGAGHEPEHAFRLHPARGGAGTGLRPKAAGAGA